MRWRTRLPWIAAAVYFLAAFAWMARDRRVTREAYPAGSVYNTSPEGLSLAYKYLRTRAGGGRVHVLTRPVKRASLEPGAVLFRVCPSAASPPEDPWEPSGEKTGGVPDKDGLLSPAEESWVHDGGRLVVAVDEGFGPIEVGTGGSGPVEKVYPVWPGVADLKPPEGRFLVGEVLDRVHGVFARGEEAVVARRPLGDGEVFVMSCPEVFQNGHIGRADHLAFLEELSGPGRPVYFDEYAHGLTRAAGTVGLLKRAGLGPLVVLLLATALTAYWRRRTREGPEEDPYRETRTEAVDFVGSLAQLYDRALTKRQAVTLYCRAFAHSVSARTGLRDEDLEKKVRELTKGLDAPAPRKGRDVGWQEFGRTLAALNDAFRRLGDVKRE